MNDKNIFASFIKKNALIKVILYAVILAVIFGVLYFWGREEINTTVLNGGLSVFTKGSVELKDVASLKYNNSSKVTTEFIYYTDIYYTKDDVDKGIYGIVEFEDGFLLCLVPIKDEHLFDEENVTITGKLRKLDGFEKGLIEEVSGDDGELIAAFYSGVLDLERYSPFNVYFQIAIQLILILFFAFWLVWHLIILFDYKKHKLYKRLGEYGDNALVMAKINEKLAAGNYIAFGKSVYFTDIYIFSEKFIYKTDDLLWSYQKTTKQYTNGIPSGKSHSLVLVFSPVLKKYEFGKAQAKIKAFLDIIAEKHPHVILGFQNYLEEAFMQAQRAKDKGIFIEACDKLRAVRDESVSKEQ